MTDHVRREVESLLPRPRLEIVRLLRISDATAPRRQPTLHHRPGASGRCFVAFRLALPLAAVSNSV